MAYDMLRDGEDVSHNIPMVQGIQQGYVLDFVWFKHWKAYAGLNRSRGKSYFADLFHLRRSNKGRPGPIDNANILADGVAELKKDLCNEQDFILIHEDAWTLLVMWYGAVEHQQPIRRKVVRHKDALLDQLEVEVYPLQLRICVFPDFDNLIIRNFSFTDSLESVDREARKAFNISDQMVTRICMNDSNSTRLRKYTTLLTSSLTKDSTVVVIKEESSTLQVNDAEGLAQFVETDSPPMPSTVTEPDIFPAEDQELKIRLSLLKQKMEEVEMQLEAELNKDQVTEEHMEKIAHLLDKSDQMQAEVKLIENERQEILERVKLSAIATRQMVLHEFENLLESELQCSICNEIFIQSVTLNCSHMFCKFCLDEWSKGKQSSECPICRNKITIQARSIALDSFVDKVMEKLSSEVKQRRDTIINDRNAEYCRQDNTSSRSSNTSSTEMDRERRSQNEMPGEQ